MSDIYPTAYFPRPPGRGARRRSRGGLGLCPVGLFAGLSAFQLGASRVNALDEHADRLDRARLPGAETVDVTEEDPVDALRELTRCIGPSRAIDAVGVESERPAEGPAARITKDQAEQFAKEVRAIARMPGRGTGNGRRAVPRRSSRPGR